KIKEVLKDALPEVKLYQYELIWRNILTAQSRRFQMERAREMREWGREGMFLRYLDEFNQRLSSMVNLKDMLISSIITEYASSDEGRKKLFEAFYGKKLDEVKFQEWENFMNFLIPILNYSPTSLIKHLPEDKRTEVEKLMKEKEEMIRRGLEVHKMKWKFLEEILKREGIDIGKDMEKILPTEEIKGLQLEGEGKKEDTLKFKNGSIGILQKQNG
ncbi:MAG: hypothetical protein NZ826_07920, partial [Thermodesulfovibrio sp.]|nr:hypothetical protein [Thermodesulfovibrio sp.]